MSEIEQSTYLAHFANPPFETSLGELEQTTAALLSSDSVIITRQRKGHASEVYIRPLVQDVSVLSANQVVLVLNTGTQRSVKPTEVLQAALGLDQAVVPLIQIHKCSAVTAGDETPVARAVALAGDTNFETRNLDQWEPTRNACGDFRR